MIQVDIFSGFLGAGKTMLIKKMIANQVYNKDTAIIENEFGEVAIDGAYLEGSGIQVKEIYSGCICCSVSGDFKQAIGEVIKNYPVKQIIIEPSGVASLSDVLKIIKDGSFKDKLILNRVITVIDGTRFEMYRNNFSAFYLNQIQHAKTLIVSRSQFLGAGEIQHIISEIEKLNSKAAIITTPWEILHGRAIAEASKDSIKEELIRKVSMTRRNIKSVTGMQQPPAREVFDSVGIEGLNPHDKTVMEQILGTFENSNTYGEILRAKGIFSSQQGKWYQFDYVPGEYEIRETQPYYTSKLCIIGKGLKKEALVRLFQK